MKILQIGLGNFGKNHLRAWQELGCLDQLWVVDADPLKLREYAAKYRIPESRCSTDYRSFFSQVDALDIVTPTDSHFDLIAEGLRCGKDVFVEKPMTINASQAEGICRLEEQYGAFVQVGYYYRYHPISRWVKAAIEENRLGKIRYISARFFGFKRGRNDVGVTHTDGIHFLDLVNWFLNSTPAQVHAVTRDHFGRGLEDFSIVLLTYPSRAIVQLESGYIQPGQWRDKVVAGALTTKSITICGEAGAIECDFESESVAWHQVRHENRGGVWTPVFGERTNPLLPTANTVEMIAAELKDFIACHNDRTQPLANANGSGLLLARLMETIYESAAKEQTIGTAAVSLT